MGLGDGGDAGDPGNRAQNLGTVLGKILRIDVDGGFPYTIPATNPFRSTQGAQPEIWAYGLRNPWRFSFDKQTGDLFIADVGQGAREEVNFQLSTSPGGQNYGWRRMEGTACFNPTTACNDGTLTLPILEYDHSLGCSITGGYRYRGRRFPQYASRFFYGDFCSGRIWTATQSGQTWTTSQLMDTSLSITSFGEDEAGELYVVHYGSGSDGTIQRIVELSQSFALTVSRAGAGTGTVMSSPGAINCGSVCSQTFGAGALVTLTATPAAGSSFTGWSGGGCSGTGTCVVVLNANTVVTATFTQQFFTLTVTTTGPGSVASSPSGISCGSTCVAGYQRGTTVTLTASAGAGATFSGWSGSCSGTSPFCAVAMTAFRSVTATFTTTFGGSFVDDPLLVNSTPVRTIHLTELRLAIDRARAGRSLAPFAWTDPVIVPGATTVKAVHVSQMRTALTQAYQAAGRAAPSFSDPSLSVGATLVRAAHIAELRAAVLALP